MQNDQCVSEPELEKFMQGNLNADRLQSIAAHVDACTPCQDTVVAMAEHSDTFVATVKAAGTGAPARQENALQLGLKRMLSSLQIPASSEANATPLSTLSQIGPYRIEQQLGAGGMGHVYRAIHTKLKRTVALKVLPANRWSNSMAVSRFEREMEAIGSLDHPHIVRASDAGEDQGMHYLVMEFIDGLDLSRLINRLGPLPVAEACELARQCAIGLDHAHENGLVHRDIKPSNLMLARTAGSQSAKPTLKILDLGLALLGDEHLQEGHEITTVGTLMGTLDYMSPEQGVDSHSVDQRTDIYSLGATLFKLLTGRAPYADPQYSTLMKKMTALATKAAPSIGSVRSDLPDELVQVIDRMLSRDPDDRFESAHEVDEALATFAKGANLDKLLRRGVATDDPPNSVTPKVAITAINGDAATLGNAAVAPNRRTSNRGPLVALLTGFLAVTAGILFYLSTDYGELTITSDDPNATVLIKRGERTVETVQIQNSEKSLSLRTGDYDLVVTGNAKVAITPATVAINRGSKLNANVKANQPPSPSDTAPPIHESIADPNSIRGSDEIPKPTEKQLERVAELNDKAERLAQQGRVKDAIAAYEEAIRVQQNFASFAGRGRALMQLGWMDEAIQSMSRALQFSKTVSDPAVVKSVYLDLGQAYLDSEQYNQALAVYGAIRQLPGMSFDAEIWFKLGIAQSKFAMQQQYSTEQTRIDQLHAALKYFDRALQMDPNHKQARIERDKIKRRFEEKREREQDLIRDDTRLTSLSDQIQRLQLKVRESWKKRQKLEQEKQSNDQDLVHNSSDSDKTRLATARLLDEERQAQALLNKTSDEYGELLASVRERRPHFDGRYINHGSALEVFVLGTSPDTPIAGIYSLDAKGRINLGPTHGSRIALVGLTAEEAEFVISRHLRTYYQNPEVTVSLLRGEQTLPSSQTNSSQLSASNASTDAVYQDHNYQYWLRILRMDRDPDKILNAIRAVGLLGEDDSATAAKTILETLRHAAGSQTAPMTVIESLSALQLDAVTSAIFDEFRQGNARSRDFLLHLTTTILQYPDVGDVQRLRNAIKQNAGELATLRLAHPSDLEKERLTVDRFLWKLAFSYELDPATVPGMSETLQDSHFRGGEFGTLREALLLARRIPETPNLAESVFSRDLQEFEIVNFAKTLGPKGIKPALGIVLEKIAKADWLNSLKLEPVIGVIGEMGTDAKEAVPVIRDIAETIIWTRGLDGKSVFLPMFNAIAQVSGKSKDEVLREIMGAFHEELIGPIDAITQEILQDKAQGKRTRDLEFRLDELQDLRNNMEAEYPWLKDGSATSGTAASNVNPLPGR